MIKKNLLSGVLLFTAVTIVSTSSAYAFTKIFQEVVEGNAEIVDIGSTQTQGESNDSLSSSAAADQAMAESNLAANATANSTASASGITLTELATHNKAGNCYIGYNGKVYNVSNHPSWGGCSHHGITGGRDITSRFPHPTSYLSGLPIVGNIITNNNGTNPTTVPTSPNTGNDGHESDDYDDDYDDDHDDYHDDDHDNDHNEGHDESHDD